MTREERLQLLKQIEKDIYVCSLESTLTDDAKSCAIHSAIEELELEKEACEDAVSREAVKEAVESTIAKYIPVFIGRYERIPLEVAMAIKNLPPVKPTRKKGKWINILPCTTNFQDQILYQCVCDKCGSVAYFRRMGGKLVGANLCSTCGAEMKEEE